MLQYSRCVLRWRRQRHLFNSIVCDAAHSKPVGAVAALQSQTFRDGFNAAIGHAHFHRRFGRRGAFVEGLEQR